MKRTTIRTSGSLAALALTMSLGLSACGGDSDTAADDNTGSTTESSAPATPEESTEESAPAEGDPASQVFGPGCAAVPTDPADGGSFEGMATEPVANAASANPLLKTLVAAVTEAGLVDTLNSAEDITVFAPTDDAFAKLPKKDLKAVLADKELLTQILTHHVVAGALTPDTLAGEHDTLNKDTVTVEGSGEEFTVDAGMGNTANVICGNVPTANATVYIVDTVLMPS